MCFWVPDRSSDLPEMVNVYITNWKDPPFSTAKSTISMVIFHSFLYAYWRVISEQLWRHQPWAWSYAVKYQIWPSLRAPHLSIYGMITLSGWWCTYPSKKWWSSSVGMMTCPIYGKTIQMFQTTNQPCIIFYHHLYLVKGFNCSHCSLFRTQPGSSTGWKRPSFVG